MQAKKLILTYWKWWFFAILPLVGTWIYGLFDLDEGFYAAVTREMINRGEWITPYYNGAPWFEKPILLYWLAKVTVMLFGDFGARLPSILCNLALYGLIAREVRTYLGDKAGWFTFAVISTSLLPIALGRMMMTDAALSLAISGALLSHFRASTTGNARARWMSGFWVGVGVLAKGPVAIILFATIAVITAWRIPELRQYARAGWVGFAIASGAVICSWYVPATLANGQPFIDEFLIRQNIGRFRGGDTAHQMPFFPFGWAFYPVVLALGMSPWILQIKQSWPSRTVREPLLQYCAWWAGIIFFFFYISSTKLLHYVLPVTPPLAIILGAYWAKTSAEDALPMPPRKMMIASVAMFCIANLGFFLAYRDTHATLHQAAKIAYEQGGKVMAYQFSRRANQSGLKLNETSHPSLQFYLHQPFITSDEPAALDRVDYEWLITRPDRLSESEIEQFKLEPVPLRDTKFLLFRRRP